MGTLDAIQVLAGVSQLLPKSRENYLNRCMDQERLRRESTNQKEMDKVGARLPAAATPGPRARGGGAAWRESGDASRSRGHRASLNHAPAPPGGSLLPRGLRAGGRAGERRRAASPAPCPRCASQAETKTRKAAESLRRLVEKYNSARSDFEQKMLDSALVRTGPWRPTHSWAQGAVGLRNPEPSKPSTPRSLRVTG